MPATLNPSRCVFFNGFMRGLIRAWLLVIPLVVALSLIRWVQIWHCWPSGFAAPPSDVLKK